MKTCLSPSKARSAFLAHLPAVIAATGILLAMTPSICPAGGWFLPTTSPAGEYHRYWAIGLSTPDLESAGSMRTLKDGTHVFAFSAPKNGGHIYLWDRISSDYNSPAVASTDASFRNYTTLDMQNVTFLRNIYGQLRDLWGDGSTREQTLLLSKLQGAIARSGDRFYN